MSTPTSHSEAGFTLVEVLVAMVLGLIVSGALFAILEVSLHQSSGVVDRVSANQRGRIAMENLITEMHSSCVASEYTPIEKGSTGSKLLLVSEPSIEASPEKVTLHELLFNSATGKLTDTYYASQSGSVAPNWTFSSSATKTVTLLTSVSEAETGGKKIPLFQYFPYEGASLSATPLSNPLTEESAEEAAAVVVTFKVAPENGNTKTNRSVTLADTAVLRYAPGALNVSGSSSPCT